MEINLEGLGVIREISFRNRSLLIRMTLEGLPDKPVSIAAEEVTVTPDGSGIAVQGFKSDMPFLHTALNRFAKGPFSIPEDMRPMLKAAKTVLDL